MALKLHAMALPSSHKNFAQSTSLDKSSKVFMGTGSSTCSLATLGVEKKRPYHPAKGPAGVQVTHSMPQEKLEIFKSLENWVTNNILTQLNHVEDNWQPHDFLPKSESEEGFFEQVKELRERAKDLPDDYLVILVASMVTEEALPTYEATLNTLDGCRDETAASPSPWAIWIRAWTAEENRHGDLLNRYLYLSGRVDMRQVEKSTQYLIGAGMDPKWENNPYRGFIYTSFQERATFIYHGSTARVVKGHDPKLAQICGTLAADEKRHEAAYVKIVEKLFEIDPDQTMLALADMMQNKITMPTQFIYDGQDSDLFQHFSAVAQRVGIYTSKDYCEILEFLIGRWKVEKLTGLSSEGRRAQDYVCGLPAKIKRLEEKRRAYQKANRARSTVPCSWIFGRDIRI